MKTINQYISVTERISSIDDYINEKLVIGDNLGKEYKYFPKDKDELIKCIEEKIEKEGLGTKNKPLDLNDIDTSEITNMSNLFSVNINGKLIQLSRRGKFDVSDWDVSNVTNMEAMFYCSAFNGDISGWNVSNVEFMQDMFWGSKFKGDISNWDVSNVKHMYDMFSWSPIEKNTPEWYNDWYNKIFN